MKLVYEPKVFLVGRQQVDTEGLKDYLLDGGFEWWSTDWDYEAEILVEVAARTCYQSFTPGKGRPHDEHIKHLLESAHGRCLEHAVWSFVLTGISRSCSHELYTHTAGWSKSMLSQRYVDHSDTAFVVPPAIRAEVEAAVEALGDWTPGEARDWVPGEARGLTGRQIDRGLDWLDSCGYALERYNRLVKYLMDQFPEELANDRDRRKWARQAARSVLPECVETKVFVTANARALRWFLEARATAQADAEIRRLAVALWRVLKVESPNLFGDYREECMPDGSYGLATGYRKV